MPVGLEPAEALLFAADSMARLAVLLREFQELLQPLQLVAALPERHSQFIGHALQIEDAFVVRF